MKTNKNATLYIQEAKENGKVYHNLIVVVEVGKDIVKLPVKMSFYNRKLAYKLAMNLPKKD